MTRCWWCTPVAGVLVLFAAGCRDQPPPDPDGPLFRADLPPLVTRGLEGRGCVPVDSGHDEQRFEKAGRARVREFVLNFRAAAPPLDAVRARAIADGILGEVEVALPDPSVSRVGRFPDPGMWLEKFELANNGVHYRVGRGRKGWCLVSVGPGEVFFHRRDSGGGEPGILMAKNAAPAGGYFVLVHVEEMALAEHDPK